MFKTLDAVHTHTHVYLLEDKKIENKHREIYLCSFVIERI